MSVTLKVMLEHLEKTKAFSLLHSKITPERAMALAIALRATPLGLLDLTRRSIHGPRRWLVLHEHYSRKVNLRASMTPPRASLLVFNDLVTRSQSIQVKFK